MDTYVRVLIELRNLNAARALPPGAAKTTGRYPQREDKTADDGGGEIRHAARNGPQMNAHHRARRLKRARRDHRGAEAVRRFPWIYLSSQAGTFCFPESLSRIGTKTSSRSPSNPVLITYLADFSVHEVDLEHIF